MPAGKRSTRGLTLLELLIVLTLVALLTGVAAPGLHGLIAGNQVRTTAGRFMTHVNLARTESIMRSQRVVLCPSADGSECLAEGHWHRGWLVFVDVDGDREHGADEPVLHRSGAAPDVALVTSVMRRRLVLYPTGLSPGSNGTYTICSETAQAPPLAVIVANTGRARLSRERPDGTPLHCG